MENYLFFYENSMVLSYFFFFCKRAQFLGLLLSFDGIFHLYREFTAEHFETNHVLCKRKRREVYKFPPIQMEFL